MFAFHRPALLAQWIDNVGANTRGVAEQPATYGVEGATFLARVQHMPSLLEEGLWPAQITAITNLEKSLRENRSRALIQMATGSGKTYAAVSFVYRLIKFAGAQRVLFLVDRNNLGRQALREFQQYVTPDDGRKFSELYNVQRLASNVLDPVSKVCITTIQRLYSMLCGEEEFDVEQEEQSLWGREVELDQEPPSWCGTIPTCLSNISTLSSPTSATAPSTTCGARCWSISTRT